MKGLQEVAAPEAVRLDWDSAAFGFEVFALKEPIAEEPALSRALESCASRGGRLVYWFAAAGTAVPTATLERFHGALVDEKVTFGRPPGGLSDESGEAPWRLRYVRNGEPSPSLVELALEAGAFSRFRMDPLMPEHVFRVLYEAWIRRCCSGGETEAVIEARSGGGDLVGMVTVSMAGETGSIGLIAVNAGARGHGLGKALVREANRCMIARGARRSTVVTQKANASACRLYYASGYEVVEESDVYHFWLR